MGGKTNTVSNCANLWVCSGHWLPICCLGQKCWYREKWLRFQRFPMWIWGAGWKELTKPINRSNSSLPNDHGTAFVGWFDDNVVPSFKILVGSPFFFRKIWKFEAFVEVEFLDVHAAFFNKEINRSKLAIRWCPIRLLRFQRIHSNSSLWGSSEGCSLSWKWALSLTRRRNFSVSSLTVNSSVFLVSGTKFKPFPRIDFSGSERGKSSGIVKTL